MTTSRLLLELRDGDIDAVTEACQDAEIQRLDLGLGRRSCARVGAGRGATGCSAGSGQGDGGLIVASCAGATVGLGGDTAAWTG
ncbi:hypothetical protein [Actinocatenispora comari]|uniref:hypothetical protein n=1 Tax=Actinocatenispora comari TaxID=2807577 RepID=UPI001A92A6C8|nr:hypothetical protein [Actinocatenispora comari]